MKIKNLTIVILFGIILSVLMTSCHSDTPSGNADTDTDTETEVWADTIKDTTPITETVVPETEQLETIVDDALRTPVENEKAIEFIEHYFAKALEVLDWVENGTLNADLSSEIMAEDGRIYFPVKDIEVRPELDGASITSLADLSKYIRSIFSPSIANSLISLAEEHYTDIEEVLCVEAKFKDTEPNIEADPSDKEAREVISVEFFLSKFTDTLFRYTAKVTFEDEEDNTEDYGNSMIEGENIEYFDFIFENTGTGWYFTAFPKLPN